VSLFSSSIHSQHNLRRRCLLIPASFFLPMTQHKDTAAAAARNQQQEGKPYYKITDQAVYQLLNKKRDRRHHHLQSLKSKVPLDFLFDASSS
jgi:hypothetical protein